MKFTVSVAGAGTALSERLQAAATAKLSGAGSLSSPPVSGADVVAASSDPASSADEPIISDIFSDLVIE